MGAWAPVFKPGVVALRPLRLGDLYDGAFKAIRQNPKTMVGLAALVTTAFMLIPVILSVVLAATGNLAAGPDPAFTGPGSSDVSVGGGGLSLAQGAGALFSIPASVLLTGICVHVVHQAALGRRTAIAEAWAAVRGRLLRLLGLTVFGAVVTSVPFVLAIGGGVLLGINVSTGLGVLVGVLGGIASVVLLCLLQVRLFFLAPAALVLERQKVFAALRRSWALTRGQFWRLFGIWLLTALIVGIVGQVISVPLGLLGGIVAVAFPTSDWAALLAVLAGYVGTIIVGAVTTPFSAGVWSLLYLDQRIRKEAYDVELIAASQDRAS